MIENILYVRGQKFHVKITGNDSLPVIVFLHGFTGSTETWTSVIDLLGEEFKCIAIDLTGHGKTTVPKDYNRYSMEEQITDLEYVFDQLKLAKFTLVGYSMGGRVALAYTLRYTKRVSSLILESASPGLIEESERIERKKADAKLSTKIMQNGIQEFVDFWEEIALFNSQKKLSADIKNAVREERLSQSKIGLANSLLGIGTGSQTSYWHQLSKIDLPVLLITGEIDKKFVQISEEMLKFLPFAEHRIQKAIGHAIHVENPVLFATMVREHIKKLLNLRR